MQGSAIAHPNVALVKYWGKQPARGNVPAMGSLSLTLGFLATRTTVRFGGAGSEDALKLNGQKNTKDLKRLQDCLAPLRARCETAAGAVVDSRNDFPTGAGLASSASGMAALALAGAAALGLEQDRALVQRAAMAGSGSAPRSLHGGLVLLSMNAQGRWSCKSLLSPEQWPLKVAVAVTDPAPKATDSRTGMERTRLSSPFYPAWLESQKADLEEARQAVVQRDFARLAALSQSNCLKMHAAALGASPPLLYFNGATVECIHRIQALAREGKGVFFTVDAGPQVKAVCLPDAFDEVCAALGEVAGVREVLGGDLGGAARIVPG